ncbi:MAG: hypothetical protein ABEI99_05535 [Halobaculum sp.]
MPEQIHSRRAAIRAGALLAAVGLTGCLGDDSLPTATPAGEREAIDLFFRNSFVAEDESGTKLNAKLRVGITAVDPDGEISTVAEDSYELQPQTTRMVSDVFTPDPAMEEYVSNDSDTAPGPDPKYQQIEIVA